MYLYTIGGRPGSYKVSSLMFLHTQIHNYMHIYRDVATIKLQFFTAIANLTVSVFVYIYTLHV